MATTIDLENRKQIRSPMDVVITMDITDATHSLTFTGYSSSAKVADGILRQSGWPMRLLADLQSDGFPLDGTHVLYDSSTTASETNGKIGVRGNIGQSVTITVSSGRSFANLSILATGAASVTYNGITSQIVGGAVVIPVNSTRVTLTFNPEDATTRIEVSNISAGILLSITNDNLISANLDLRADLSPLSPSFPTSEINVSFYNDADISEQLATIEEGYPVSYSAGYDSDMSPVRKFYLSEKATWKDGVLTFKAEDASTKLDAGHYPIQSDDRTYLSGLWRIYMMFVEVITGCGITCESIDPAPGKRESGAYNNDVDAYVMRDGARQFVADMMNLGHQTIPSTILRYGSQDFWPTFVDAGLPKISWYKPTPKWDIYEEDCANIEREADRLLKEVSGTVREQQPFTGEWPGSTTDVENYVDVSDEFLIRFGASGVAYVSEPSPFFDTKLCIQYAGRSDWETFVGVEWLVSNVGYYELPYDNAQCESVSGGDRFGMRMIENRINLNRWDPSITSDTDFRQQWTQIVGSLTKAANAKLMTQKPWGWYDRDVVANKAGNGTAGVIESIPDGHMNIMRYGITPSASSVSESDMYRFMPEKGIESVLSRSNSHGKFTWKGHPKMQPRDVVRFHRLDGTIENITLENISMKHEGGGLMCEMTYWKGIV